MALVADVELPTPTPEARPAAGALIWIATDAAPFRSQQWPATEPVPPGWHEVTAAQARALAKPGPISIQFLPDPPQTSLESEAAALSTAEPSLAAVAARSLSRAPREARLPRSPRAARPPRAGRPPRAERAPRKPRRPRLPKKPRLPRRPRKPRPKNFKTKQPPGVCKGPGCTCWTPGGCAGDWYLTVFGDFTKTDCYRGPCYDYEACVSDKCQVHAACAINEIIQFWARQYRAVVTYVSPVLVPVGNLAITAARALPVIGTAALLADVVQGLPAGAVSVGCSQGEYWTMGLTGCRCVPIGSGLIAITKEQVIGCIGQDAWDYLESQGQQGQTG